MRQTNRNHRHNLLLMASGKGLVYLFCSIVGILVICAMLIVFNLNPLAFSLLEWMWNHLHKTIIVLLCTATLGAIWEALFK